MSQESVEVVRAVVTASQRGDWPAAIARFHPDVELDQSRMPDGGVYRGADQLWSFYRNWFGSWEQIEISPQRFIELEGDKVLVLLKLRAKGRGTGVHVSMETADLYTVLEGRIDHATGYPDQREALEAAGLRE